MDINKHICTIVCRWHALACKERTMIETLKKLLGAAFDMKDLESAKKILGMNIIKNKSEGSIVLSQEKYIKRVLKTYNMLDSKLVQVLLTALFRLYNLYCPNLEEEKLEMLHIPYTNALSCPMYAMVLTRLDISHAISVVSRYMALSSKGHWKGAKWIWGILKAPSNLDCCIKGKQRW